jgi:hypothetical protein
MLALISRLKIDNFIDYKIFRAVTKTGGCQWFTMESFKLAEPVTI